MAHYFFMTAIYQLYCNAQIPYTYWNHLNLPFTTTDVSPAYNIVEYVFIYVADIIIAPFTQAILPHSRIIKVMLFTV